MSDKPLTFKVVMLSGLTQTSRVRGLHILDAKFMAKISQKYVFKFQKLHKSWRQGQKLTTLGFVAFSQDKDFCVVSALDEYLNRAEELRRLNNETQLKSSDINAQLNPVVEPKFQRQVLLVYQRQEFWNVELGQTSLLGKGYTRRILSRYV